MTRSYAGTRAENRTCIVRVVEDGISRSLDPRLDLDNHSPTGFEWGYGGSGPAQLALAILADALGDDRLALRMHQPFKRALIASLDRDSDWVISHAAVLGTVNSLQAEGRV